MRERTNHADAEPSEQQIEDRRHAVAPLASVAPDDDGHAPERPDDDDDTRAPDDD